MNASASAWLELILAVADDHDSRRVDPEPNHLPCEERAVQVVAVAADKLAAGDDDERAGSRVCHTPGRMPLGVTIKVFGPPTGRRRARPFSTIVMFSGRSSVIQSRLPVKICGCPYSSVP